MSTEQTHRLDCPDGLIHVCYRKGLLSKISRGTVVNHLDAIGDFHVRNLEMTHTRSPNLKGALQIMKIKYQFSTWGSIVQAAILKVRHFERVKNLAHQTYHAYQTYKTYNTTY